MSTDHRFEEPVRRALADAASEGDTYWKVVTDLQRTGGSAAFAMASTLCTSAIAAERELGVNILAQLDYEQPLGMRPHREATIGLLSRLLASDQDVGVLRACGSAFGHLGDHGNPEELLAHRDHLDDGVRERVGIGIRVTPVDQRAIDVALELSRDPVARVREWPLLKFSDPELATVPRIWRRLVEALGDVDLTCRAEAMCGLATGSYPGIVEVIAAELASATPGADSYAMGRLEMALDLALHRAEGAD
jgi:HEAT repeat protein